MSRIEAFLQLKDGIAVTHGKLCRHRLAVKFQQPELQVAPSQKCPAHLAVELTTSAVAEGPGFAATLPAHLVQIEERF